jgi:hypothetical protein
MCHNAIWLRNGKVAAAGKAESVVNAYVADADRSQAVAEDSPGGSRWGSREVEILEVTVRGEQGGGSMPVTGRPFAVRIRYLARASVEYPVFGIGIHRVDGVHVTGPNTATGRFEIARITGHGVVEFAVPRLPLLPGIYVLSAAVYDRSIRHPYDHHDGMYRFRVGREGTLEAEGVVSFDGHWTHTEGNLTPAEVNHA